MLETEARVRTWIADLIYPAGRQWRHDRKKERIAAKEEARHLFLDLWSKAHDNPDYVKKEWCRLSNLLCALGVQL